MPHLLPGCLHWPGGSTQRGEYVHAYGQDRGRGVDGGWMGGGGGGTRGRVARGGWTGWCRGGQGRVDRGRLDRGRVDRGG